jgi:hypothetical protein
MNQNVDNTFSLMNEISFFVFFMEFLLSSLFESNFIGSFFFWIDLISMMSVIPDVPILWNPIANSISGGNSDLDPFEISNNKEIQRTGIATGASST